MKFSEKLDFLMTLTNTTNSSLAFYTSLDPSHISRLRRGQRNAAKNESYLSSMAVYFARHCIEQYQRKALYDNLNISPAAFAENEWPELILAWLRGEQNAQQKTVSNFLKSMSEHSTVKLPDLGSIEQISTLPETKTSVFYGSAGKQQAVMHLLSMVLSCSKPQNLQLFSDEDLDWLTADPSFVKHWASLMVQVIARGNRVSIIHTVSRNLHEMLAAISQWMPLYMTGMIEPYYYPKKRDGVFKRTLFIAPNVAAIVSCSVGSMVEQAANNLFTDRKIIQAYSEEFRQYIALCKPLMRIYTAKDHELFLSALSDFETKQVPSLIKTDSLSLVTMPEPVAAGIFPRMSKQRVNLLRYHWSRFQGFRKYLKSNSYTEIVYLPEISDVQNGMVKVSFSDMFGCPVYYTAQEYLTHLEHIVFLLETYNKFHIFLLASDKDAQYSAYVREDLGVMVIKSSAPPVVLAFNENNLTAAFWDFLMNMIGDNSYQHPNNQETADKLTNYILRLKQAESDKAGEELNT